VRYHVAASLDGFISPLDGSVDWLTGAAGGDGFAKFFETIGGIVMGRNGFETELGFGNWSYSHIPVLVMTHRPIDNQPEGVEIAAGDPAPALLAPRARVERGDIWLFGGGRAAGSFLEAGLIDRIEITTIPVVLGSGRGLFAGTGSLRQLKLLHSGMEGPFVHSVYLPMAPSYGLTPNEGCLPAQAASASLSDLSSSAGS